MNKHKHKIITFAALMTAATAVVHFTNRTIAAAAQLKQVGSEFPMINSSNGASVIFTIQKKEPAPRSS